MHLFEMKAWHSELLNTRLCLCRERLEREKAIALQKELERAAREKERMEMEEKRKMVRILFVVLMTFVVFVILKFATRCVDG